MKLLQYNFLSVYELVMPQIHQTSFTAETGSNWKQKQFRKT